MGSARYVAPQAQPRTAAHTSPENQDDSRFDKPSRWSRIPAVLPKRSPAMKLATKHASRPTDYVGIAVRIGTITLALLLPLIFMTASAPLSATPLPDVEERFHDWVLTQNSITVRDLPGDTPEPGSLAAQIVSQVESQEDPAAEQAPVQTPAPTAPPAAPEERYPQYASGELVHETDTLSVSIEQYNDGENTYYVADVLIKDPLQFGYAFSYDTFKGARESVSDIADRHQAVIAINSDFAGFHNEGVIIRGFELFRKQNVKAKRHLLIVDQQGDMSALTDRSEKQGVVANRLMNEGVMHTFEFGPLLVENGEAVELPKSFVIRAQDGYYEPRTAIGQIGPLHYILIVVDGRQEGYSKGVSLPRLQELFIEHGAEFAFNLDGGGSTTLYFKGKVINHPSSGDERRVSDIIMFKD